MTLDDIIKNRLPGTNLFLSILQQYEGELTESEIAILKKQPIQSLYGLDLGIENLKAEKTSEYTQSELNPDADKNRNKRTLAGQLYEISVAKLNDLIQYFNLVSRGTIHFTSRAPYSLSPPKPIAYSPDESLKENTERFERFCSTFMSLSPLNAVDSNTYSSWLDSTDKITLLGKISLSQIAKQKVPLVAYTLAQLGKFDELNKLLVMHTDLSNIQKEKIFKYCFSIPTFLYDTQASKLKEDKLNEIIKEQLPFSEVGAGDFLRECFQSDSLFQDKNFEAGQSYLKTYIEDMLDKARDNTELRVALFRVALSSSNAQNLLLLLLKTYPDFYCDNFVLIHQGLSLGQSANLGIIFDSQKARLLEKSFLFFVIANDPNVFQDNIWKRLNYDERNEHKSKTDANGNTLLHTVLENKYNHLESYHKIIQLVQLFRESVNQPNKNNETPIKLALKCQSITALEIKTLIKVGADVSDINVDMLLEMLEKNKILKKATVNSIVNLIKQEQEKNKEAGQEKKPVSKKARFTL